MSFLRQAPSNGSYTLSSEHSSPFPNAMQSFPFTAAVRGSHGSSCPPQPTGNYTGEYSEELWQACAGPLVYVPSVGEKVLYFPQGHMEQVAASTQQGSCQQLPNQGLDAQIVCRVISRTLSAEPETDEVYAQISLLPESNQIIDPLEIEKPSEPSPVAQPNNSNVRRFTKILTASDTSTHGGFSVLRKHAEECLPPLDMKQDPPSQELVAKDLHGTEWRFRHTYRGHPRRHLLTTGWSVFVSNKRLMAGDAVIFLRGPNGELRVGIRRAKRQQAAQQAVMSSHSMHMGVVATASHALLTRTMFSVYYKPRVSNSPFLVPIKNYAKAMSLSLSVGMRFKMSFETEDASDRSYTGTITGIDDLDPNNWRGSKWRSLKVNWDEMFNNERHDRVSPWEIELCVSSPQQNTPPPTRKRIRQAPSPSTSTLTELSGAGKTPLENMYPSKIPRVLQGQEPRGIVMSSLWRSNNNSESMLQQQAIPLGSPPSTLQAPNPRASFYSPFISQNESDLKLSVNSPANVLVNGPNHGMIPMSPWAAPSPEIGHSPPGWFMPLLSQPTTPSMMLTGRADQKSLVTGNLPSPQLYNVHQPQPQPHQRHSNATHPFNGMWLETPKQERITTNDVSSSVPDTGCKLFGISLTESARGNNMKANVQTADSEEDNFKGEVFQPSQVHSTEHELPKSESTTEPEEKLDQSTVECRTRSCTKVIKKGSMGRGIDLSKFDNYNSLLQELETMFNMEGLLIDPDKGWQVAYSDSEGDTMKVGDDPWSEFCSMVKKLYILSPEEVNAGQGEVINLLEKAS